MTTKEQDRWFGEFAKQLAKISRKIDRNQSSQRQFESRVLAEFEGIRTSLFDAGQVAKQADRLSDATDTLKKAVAENQPDDNQGETPDGKRES